MNYKLRSKTTALFKTSDALAELSGLIDRVCKMSEQEARQFIWQFTYNPNGAMGKHIICLKDPTEQKMRVIRGELINQYREVHPGFGYQKYMVPQEGESEAIGRLRKQTKSDDVAVYEIMETINKCFLNKEMLISYAKWLKNNKFKNNMTALKDIGFRGEGEAGYVMNCASIIADLLEERAKSEFI